MKSRFLALIVILCISVTNINFTVFASDRAPVIYSVVNDGEVAIKSGYEYFYIVNPLDTEVNSDGLGGKQKGDNYASMKTTSSGQTYMEIYLFDSSYTRRYAVFSYSIYSNNSDLKFISRHSSTVQPGLARITKSELMPNRWNNIQYVFDTNTLDTYYILNGVKYAGGNLGEGLKGTDYADKKLINQFRLLFDSRGAAVSYDDVSCYVSDVAPTIFEYGSVTEADGFENNSKIIVGNKEPVAFSSQYDYKVCKSGSDKWTAETTVSIGDVIFVEKPCFIGDVEYYKTYNYITCVEPSVRNEIANQSTLSFFQGGSPRDSKGNAVADTRYNEKNIYGSGLTMEFAGVGINNSNSRQTYYYTDWKKALTFTEKYLVFEADVAFAAKKNSVVPTYYFGLSTNGGVVIGSQITGSKVTNRVNHYVWIYNAQSGTYSDYVNGELLHEGVQIAEKFKNGSATAIRFGVNGNVELNNSDKTKLYGGYMQNIILYECNTMPEVKQPLRAPGEKFNTVPVTTDSISVSDIIAMFPEGANVTVCKNRDYVPLEDAEATIDAGSGIIITEKDGIYDYIRVVRGPSINPAYALETVRMQSDGDVLLSFINYGESRHLTPMIVGYDETGAIVTMSSYPKEYAEGEIYGISFEGDEKAKSLKLFVWDSLGGLYPVDGTISLK